MVAICEFGAYSICRKGLEVLERIWHEGFEQRTGRGDGPYNRGSMVAFPDRVKALHKGKMSVGKRFLNN